MDIEKIGVLMSELYCVYKNERYKAEVHGNMVEVTSTSQHEGFKNYIDVIGRIHDDLFVKNLGLDEVDLLYKEEVFIRYKGIYFETYSGKILPSHIRNNTYIIFTNSDQLAREYVFEKKEQFVYIKDITREDIEIIKIVKRPVLKFKNLEAREEILEGNALDKWLKELV